VAVEKFAVQAVQARLRQTTRQPSSANSASETIFDRLLCSSRDLRLLRFVRKTGGSESG